VLNVGAASLLLPRIVLDEFSRSKARVAKDDGPDSVDRDRVATAASGGSQTIRYRMLSSM
jgi:hypothetical protein